jgi:trehalose 6-phosphate phosphatase
MHQDPKPPDLTRDAALFLDFDGTLTEIAPRPDAVRPRAPLPALLTELQHLLGGAVAVVSGRPLAEIDAYLGPSQFAGAGVHGAEIRHRPREQIRRNGSPPAGALVRAVRQRFEPEPLLVVEDKGAAVALHYRQAPDRAEECIQFMRQVARDHGFDLLIGKAVVEARPAGINKGGALVALMAELPFRGRRPVFIGDDVTDEEGFAAIERQGGVAIKVGPGESRARYRLADVTAVHAWLERAIGHLREDGTA